MSSKMTELPILYTFRRCPYAIRARMAIAYSQICCELREVLLRDKPATMLAASAKGTVPIVVLPNGQVLAESLDIMDWALAQNDSQNWLQDDCSKQKAIIAENDDDFKYHLDRYKYPDRFAGADSLRHRSQAEQFLRKLESLLENSPFLLGNTISLADIAVFPFIRQFSKVDWQWFSAIPYPKLQRWLEYHIQSELFVAVMRKYKPWQEGDVVTLFPFG